VGDGGNPRSAGRSGTALFEAGGREREERATALQHARSHLHQAHGALVMVDVAGASLLTAGAEQALARFRDGSLEYTVDHAQVVAELYQALTEYGRPGGRHAATADASVRLLSGPANHAGR
jgi:chemotaxis protein histidine kinase CheA